MPYQRNSDLPDSIKVLPAEAQTIWRKTFNSADADGKDEEASIRIAWASVKQSYKQTEDGWVKKESNFTLMAEIKKIDEDKRQVFGFASIVEKNGEAVVDDEGDVISPEEIEKAAYKHVLLYREAGERHVTKGVGILIESMVITPEKMEAMADVLKAQGVEAVINIPAVAWWIGYHVTDEEVWKGIKDGTYTSFSIGGAGIREQVD